MRSYDLVWLVLHVIALSGAVYFYWQSAIDLELLQCIFFFVFIALGFWGVLKHQISNRKKSEQELEANLIVIRNVLESLPEIVFCKDCQGVYRLCNQNAADFVGKQQSELIGSTDLELFDEKTALALQRRDKEVIELKDETVNEEWVPGPDGSYVLLETHKKPFYDPKGKCLGILGVSRDITAQYNYKKKLEHIAHHDYLTGLPNRLLLNEKLEYALQIAKRNNHFLAVIFIDMDKFKQVNDSLGHSTGDLLLKDVASRLLTNTRESDICARLGGDEFVIALSQLDSIAYLRDKCKKLLKVLGRPYHIQGHTLTLYASIGVSIFPEHATIADELLSAADVALNKAKETGRNCFFIYEPDLATNINSRITLERDLGCALENRQLCLLYQPQCRLRSTTPIRAEALLRWHHPTLGDIPPSDFIPIAEANGMINELGDWVIRQSCIQFLNWREQGLTLEKIAVNVSALQINSDFSDRLESILRKMNFKPYWLEIEVTESLMMTATTEISEQIRKLRKLGVEFSIDDFGTGFSSLSKIKSMPVTSLKLDQSFVHNINDDVNDYEISRAIILMARSLGLTVIAEGIENSRQENTLQRLGCEIGQGFYYAKPMKGDDFLRNYGC